MIRNEFSEEGPLPPGLLVQITFLSGPLEGKSMNLLKRKNIVGRSKGEIALQDNAVSGEHAEIGFEDGRLYIQDLNSTNGTLLNGGQIYEAFINSGDEVTCGGSVFRVDIKQSAQSASWASLGGEAAEEAPEVDESEVTQLMPERDGKDPLEGQLPAGAKAGLQVLSGPDSGKKYILKKRGVVVGRSGDLQLSDPNVSRKHASIEFMSANRVILKDLRSTNGTFLNDKWVSVSNLSNGDMIKVGNSTIKFFLSLPQG